MTEVELIDFLKGDQAIGVKEFIALRDHYILCVTRYQLGDSRSLPEYMVEYVRFLENHFIEDL